MDFDCDEKGRESGRVCRHTTAQQKARTSGSDPTNSVQRADRRIACIPIRFFRIRFFECSSSKAIIELQLVEGIDRSELLPPGFNVLIDLWLVFHVGRRSISSSAETPGEVGD